MDVPGRDPVVLLWAWWVSLALSHSLNLRHSPCGFLYNHPYCTPMTPLRVCVFLAVMAGDCGDEISSKSQTAISRHHVMCDFRDSSQSSLIFLVICLQTFLPVLPDVISVPFPRFLRVFSIFACRNTELLLNFLCQACYSLCQTAIFKKILDVRSSHPASLFSFNVPSHYCLSLRGPTIVVVVSSSS